MSGLRVRKPTGKTAWPLILVEGEEKAGKSFAAYSLSASEQVGRTFVVDLGEGTADEYGSLGPFEVVEHNGTFTTILDQMRAAAAVPAVDDRPNVIVLDDATALWDLLKDWAMRRARDSRAGRRTLAADPDAEIAPTMNLWNDAKDRWQRIVDLLRFFPGVAVVCARGREVAKVVDGQPVIGETVWRVDAEKNLAFDCSAWVRMTRPHQATLIAVRSLTVDVPASGIVLPANAPLEHLVFDLLAGEGFERSRRIVGRVGVDRAAAKSRLLELVAAGGVEGEAGKEIARSVWPADDPAELTDEEYARVAEAARGKLAELAGGRPFTDDTDDTDGKVAG